MSNGEIQVEMFYSSSVVKSVETFDAAATGILDCDFTGGGYQTGKNPGSSGRLIKWPVRGQERELMRIVVACCIALMDSLINRPSSGVNV